MNTEMTTGSVPENLKVRAVADKKKKPSKFKEAFMKKFGKPGAEDAKDGDKKPMFGKKK